MPKSHPPYAPEFRRQMVELVRSGRTPEELSREFEPTAQARSVSSQTRTASATVSAPPRPKRRISSSAPCPPRLRTSSTASFSAWRSRCCPSTVPRHAIRSAISCITAL
jgi:hypothetical protein